MLSIIDAITIRMQMKYVIKEFGLKMIENKIVVNDLKKNAKGIIFFGE